MFQFLSLCGLIQIYLIGRVIPNRLPHPLSRQVLSVQQLDLVYKMSTLAHLRTKPLTLKQERRLVVYLDDQFLQLTRGYKKRTSPSTIVPTLHKYITFTRKLLAFILQIPPVDPSTELRTQYLLRLTGDALSAIVGYTLPSRSGPPATVTVADSPSPPSHTGETNGMDIEHEAGQNKNGGTEDDDEEPRDYTSALRELLDWLDDLDQAWLAVLQSQVWDPEVGEGVDLVLEIGGNSSEESGETVSNANGTHDIPKSTPMSQTDVTRLRSLLVTSIANLEEWLSRGGGRNISATGGDEGDVAAMLERLGLLDEFDDLFQRTMDFLSGFGGGFVIEPDTIVEADDDEDMSDMVEVTMSGCS